MGEEVANQVVIDTFVEEEIAKRGGPGGIYILIGRWGSRVHVLSAIPCDVFTDNGGINGLALALFCGHVASVMPGGLDVVGIAFKNPKGDAILPGAFQFMAARAAKGSPISFIPSFAQDDYPPVTHRLFVTNEGSKITASWINMLEATTPEECMTAATFKTKANLLDKFHRISASIPVDLTTYPEDRNIVDALLEGADDVLESFQNMKYLEDGRPMESDEPFPEEHGEITVQWKDSFTHYEGESKQHGAMEVTGDLFVTAIIPKECSRQIAAHALKVDAFRAILHRLQSISAEDPEPEKKEMAEKAKLARQKILRKNRSRRDYVRKNENGKPTKEDVERWQKEDEEDVQQIRTFQAVELSRPKSKIIISGIRDPKAEEEEEEPSQDKEEEQDEEDAMDQGAESCSKRKRKRKRNKQVVPTTKLSELPTQKAKITLPRRVHVQPMKASKSHNVLVRFGFTDLLHVGEGMHEAMRRGKQLFGTAAAAAKVEERENVGDKVPVVVVMNKVDAAEDLKNINAENNTLKNIEAWADKWEWLINIISFALIVMLMWGYIKPWILPWIEGYPIAEAEFWQYYFDIVTSHLPFLFNET
eukprot:TRINITY_DN4082_c0_g1_i1.p1 TRINITY_DN4082_c0_g1~~TRINITY_DN4082_c0_g1_i1.p1  ORF type:complete len:590 (-),score=175.36 TRINITY_DN4082_c0_g1_i1:36-1805(-)